MLTKTLALKIFEAFSIERWNDLVRPFDLTEMDKSAEKVVLAYIIGKYEESSGKIVDWDWIIYASLFELFRKIALCDIKSPVQRMIKNEYPGEYSKINEWVISQYEAIIEDEDLMNRFKVYIRDCSSDESNVTKRIFRAAHKYSAMREFEMISLVNEPFRLRKIQEDLLQDIESYLDLRGLQLLMTKQKPYQFLMIIEQLRFQTRWNQTPRIPKTSVLGHSFFVALETLLLCRQSPVSMHPKRIYNNFFSALFHDLPEAVTRDIISPVKQATQGLPSIVKQIEDEIVKRDLVPLMEDFYANELLYFTSNEFENRICMNNDYSQVEKVTFDELNAKYNDTSFSPVDGALVRCADHAAAFIEADSSIKYGITSAHLCEGKENIRKIYSEGMIISGFEIGEFFARFS